MRCSDHITHEQRREYPNRLQQLVFSMQFGETPDVCTECHDAWWLFERRDYEALMHSLAHAHDATCATCRATLAMQAEVTMVKIKLAQTDEVVTLVQQWADRALAKRKDGTLTMLDWMGHDPYIKWVASEIGPKEGHEQDAWTAASKPATIPAPDPTKT